MGHTAAKTTTNRAHYVHRTRERERVSRKAREAAEKEEKARAIELSKKRLHDSKHKQALKKKEKRLMEDKILDNQELLRQQRQVKEERAEFERLRAIESQEDTIKDMEKKEYDKEKQKRLLADKYIDNRELERVKREAKRDEEWEVRARQVEDEEQTLHHLKVEEKKRQKEKRLKADKYIDNAERQRVVREAKRDEEWEVRARQVEVEEQTKYHLKVQEEFRLREKRLKEDKYATPRHERLPCLTLRAVRLLFAT